MQSNRKRCTEIAAGCCLQTHNHIFLCGGVGEWQYEYLAGIVPTSPGYATLRVKPLVSKTVGPSSVNATVRTVRGVVTSSWTRATQAVGETRLLTLDVRVPAAVQAAEVHVPLMGLRALDVMVRLSGAGTALLLWDGVSGGPQLIRGVLGCSARAAQGGEVVVVNVAPGGFTFTVEALQHHVPLRTDDEYVQTPMGLKHTSCVFEWPSGTTIAQSHAVLPNGTLVSIPPCIANNRSASSEPASRVTGEYGWGGYAASVGYRPECPDSKYNTRCSAGSKPTGRGPVTHFSAEFDVPAKPGVDTERTATFIFNGLEGLGDGGAWILQPVLQYCARVLSTPCQPTERNQWQFRSYYCGPKTGPEQNCHCGPGIDVSPGQRLTGDMVLLPDGDWQVLGTGSSSTQAIMLTVHGVGDQVYANLALEIWFTKSCASYPGPLVFNVTKLIDSSGPLLPVWTTKYEHSKSCVRQGTCDPAPPFCNPHVSTGQSAMVVTITHGQSCASALSSACGSARVAGSALCFACTGTHQRALMEAACTQHDFDAFCRTTTRSYTISGFVRADGVHVYDQLEGQCNGWETRLSKHRG